MARDLVKLCAALGALGAVTGVLAWWLQVSNAATVSTAFLMVILVVAAGSRHIAAADDTAMTDLEKRMATAERMARDALSELASLIQPASRARLAAAVAALDRLMEVNAQIVALSRRNTNVRSLALTLNQKGIITARCEESLRALEDALSRRGFTGTR